MANTCFHHSFLIYFEHTKHYKFTSQIYVTNLHLLRVELRCELQEKLQRVTGPLHMRSILATVRRIWEMHQ